MKKSAIVLILVAVIVVAVVAYVILDNRSEPTGASDVFLVDAAGKQLETSDGKVRLRVQPGALINQTNITIKPSQADVENYAVVSAYEFGPEGTSFLLPATLSIAYNPSNLPLDVKESDLKLCVQLPSGTAELTNSTVDTNDHVVMAQLSHFSRVFLGASKVSRDPNAPAIVGKWDRQDGADKYTFYPDGTCRTLLFGTYYRGMWYQNKTDKHEYYLDWEHSPSPTQDTFKDWITVSDDSSTYTGYNNYQNSIHCVRVSDNQPPNVKINLPKPPNAVEQEITLSSATTDPDDPAIMLEYLWTVTAPNKEIISTSTAWLEQTTFTPHQVGDYIAKLEVSDGELSRSASVLLTITPNVTMWPVMFGSGEDLPQNSVVVTFMVENNGAEPVSVVAYANFTGTRGNGATFEIGPYRMTYGREQSPAGAVIRGRDAEGNPGLDSVGDTFVPFPFPDTTKPYEFWYVKAMSWNAYLTVNGQTTLYADPPWAKPTTLPDQDIGLCVAK